MKVNIVESSKTTVPETMADVEIGRWYRTHFPSVVIYKANNHLYLRLKNGIIEVYQYQPTTKSDFLYYLDAELTLTKSKD